jgi:hypothetical protein
MIGPIESERKVESPEDARKMSRRRWKDAKLAILTIGKNDAHAFPS